MESGGVIIEEDENGKKWAIVGVLKYELPEANSSVDILNGIAARIANDLKPLVADGVPELGLPSLDPFYFDQIDFKRKKCGGILAVNASARKLILTGISNYCNEKLQLNLKEKCLDCKFEIPRVIINGSYDVGGKIVYIPVKGRGKLTLYLNALTVTGRCHLQIQDGAVQVDSIDLRLDVQDIKADLEWNNLFRGKGFIAHILEKAVNGAAQHIYKEIQPEIEEAIEEVIISIANAVLKALPFLTEYLV